MHPNALPSISGFYRSNGLSIKQLAGERPAFYGIREARKAQEQNGVLPSSWCFCLSCQWKHHGWPVLTLQIVFCNIFVPHMLQVLQRGTLRPNSTCHDVYFKLFDPTSTQNKKHLKLLQALLNNIISNQSISLYSNSNTSSTNICIKKYIKCVIKNSD